MKFLAWLRKWWILCIVCVLIFLYLYIFLGNTPQRSFLPLIQFLITSLVSVAIILYVIYTRELTISSEETAKASRKTAEANVKLVESMQSMLLEEWICEFRDDLELIRGGEEVSKLIYIEDKHLAEDAYNSYRDQEPKRILIFKPFNCGTKPVILKSAKFQINDTRSNKKRDISYDPDHPVVLKRDEAKEVPILYNIEGEIEVRVTELVYQESDKIITKWMAKPYKEIDRYQQPESLIEPSEPKAPF